MVNGYCARDRTTSAEELSLKPVTTVACRAAGNLKCQNAAKIGQMGVAACVTYSE